MKNEKKKILHPMTRHNIQDIVSQENSQIIRSWYNSIQEICARIGLVSGKGLSSAIEKRYSKNVVLPLTILLIIANTVNIGADIAANVSID